MAKNDDDDEESGHPPAVVSGIGHSKSGGHKSLNQIFRDDGDDGGGDVAYVFVEYPKWVGGVLCADADAEAAVNAAAHVPDERARLAALAVANGVEVDKRWGPARMAQALTDAGVKI